MATTPRPPRGLRTPPIASASIDRDPDEQADLRGLIAEIVTDPNTWMDTPNEQLGGNKPNDLIGTDSEERLRDLARAIKVGMPP